MRQTQDLHFEQPSIGRNWRGIALWFRVGAGCHKNVYKRHKNVTLVPMKTSEFVRWLQAQGARFQRFG